MNYVGQLAESVFATVKELYQDLNPATLSGCIDVVVVRQPDNSFKCSPFHVRFGKLGVLRSKEKVVDIEINGKPVDLHMKLGNNGEAFFVEELEEHEVGYEELMGSVPSLFHGSIPFFLCTSPICKKWCPKDAVEPSCGQEASSFGVILHKKRQRRRRPKKKEVLDSDSDSCDETENKLPAPSITGFLALNVLALVGEYGAAVYVRPHITFSSCSFMVGHQYSSKSDSELEIKPRGSFSLAAESHMKWTWGRLPQVGPSSCSSAGNDCPKDLQKAEEAVARQPFLCDALGNFPPSDLFFSIPLAQRMEVCLKLFSDVTTISSLAGSDTEQSLRPVTDPSSPVCIQLPSTLPANSPMDSDSMPTVALSLCGGLRGNRPISHEKFMEHMVSYQQFAENPRLISDPNLVIMINQKYYNWAVAGPIVLALQAFQRNIPESIIDQLVKEKMPKKERRYWLSWRRREFPTEGVCLVESFFRTLADPFPFLCRWEEMESPSDNEPQHPGDISTVEAATHNPLPTFKKSLRLSSKQIGRLNLQDGPNEVAFSVTTQYQGTCRCEATIYLWNWNEKVVISDIDGTITKSDTLGHILPQLGKDWTHPGIVKLFHKIHLNGYKFLYCSARAIGMAHITKGYLKWVNEQGCGLPMGPMLLSPSSLWSAFHREVIEKKPEVFKVTCLTDIRKLFTTKCPFYAGFGNRPNDVYTYKQVGLPESRIFTVNPKGELIQELSKNQKSTYEQLSELVEVFFPPVGQRHCSGVPTVQPLCLQETSTA
uniref:phosphatidate phosphatase n=1 Tax=Taeniopygia guttata TaxID=59729 RepID=H0Z368_TAEGU